MNSLSVPAIKTTIVVILKRYSIQITREEDGGVPKAVLKKSLNPEIIISGRNNPDFNYGEFATIKSQPGLNSYKISVKEWTEKTNAIGLRAKAGRYGGTYAHSDIAFEFGMWISAEFKVYLIKEFKRLKIEENDRLQLEWNFQRILAKVNYHINTDAIKENLIPEKLSKKQISFVYANEADVLNMALFGKTAK
ncbi:KilA-N domain-containing protein [Cyclobacterium lianum]|uniref:KilA-N domain-containing protein n=1 Tax=Cyclobacterium lianum TaxID=388280 RepID=A0A1M7HV45_9BACT|nr:KilA-N domain-containing protein [Cyclobacterium lianum]